MATLTERFADQIDGVIQCPDRVVITGTLPTACYAEGMTRLLGARKVRVFDYFEFTKPLKDGIHEKAKQVAAEAGLEIEFLRKAKDCRKEERIQEILQERGDHPGLVHVFSAMETCTSYKPWHDKPSGRTFLKPDSGRCLHYYFYFIDEQLGLCYLRVPTWCPFRLQFYFNGHNWLARQLERRGIGYRLLDNAFVAIDDWEQAQRVADKFDVRKLHRRLDRWAAKFCGVHKKLGESYHWSLMQAEYATDLVFRSAEVLAPLYEEITRTAVSTVKADKIATFLGRKLHGNYEAQMGSHFHTRIEGTCIRHEMAGQAAIKMYDKFGFILRIETTVNDVSFFRHYRQVEHRDGSCTMQQAPMQKIAKPAQDGGRSYRGFNLMASEDHQLFVAIARGEHHLSGLTNRALRKVLPDLASAQISRHLKRLRTHGLIKKIGRTYKYYLTKLGQAAVVAALKVRDTILIPTLVSTANC